MTRIKDIGTTTTTVAADDYVALDGATNGSRKILASSAVSGPVFHVQEQQTAGTNGGGSTSGSWQTRVLNTSVLNEISGASLSSNQITLPAGTYVISASQVLNRSGESRARIRNVTDGTNVGLSLTIFIATTTGLPTTIVAIPAYKFTLASSKVLELQYYIASSKTVDGLGYRSTFDTEIYADVFIEKVG